VGAMTLVVMVGGVAFAGYWGARFRPSPAPAVVAPRAPSAPPSRKHHAAASSRTEVDVAPDPPADGAPPVVDRSPPASASHRAVTTARTLALAHHADTPASLFEAANRARRRGDTAAADAAYEAVLTKYPTSREALTSRAVVGQWMLDRGQPRAAISLFRRYLADAPTGDMEEDVLFGLSVAQEAIGESAAAAVTRRRLLAEHPASVHAERASKGLRSTRTEAAR